MTSLRAWNTCLISQSVVQINCGYKGGKATQEQAFFAEQAVWFYIKTPWRYTFTGSLIWEKFKLTFNDGYSCAEAY